MPAEIQAHPLAEVVRRTNVPSERWLRELLNAGKIPGHKAGRTWLMTNSDITALLEYIARPAHIRSSDSQSIAEPPVGLGLTPRSRAHVRRKSA